MTDRWSDSFKQGRRDGERAYSDYGYDRDKYDRHGSERQRNYASGWEESREEHRWEERRREEEERRERDEQRRAEENRRQREYEDEMAQQQQQYEYEEQKAYEEEQARLHEEDNGSVTPTKTS